MSPASDIVEKEFAATWQWRIDTDPELAASLGMLSRRRSKHALDPRSLDSFDQRLAWVKKALERIKIGITPEEIENQLTEEERLSLKLYTQQLEDYTHYTSLHKAYFCCVNRLEGPQTDLPLYCSYLPVKTHTDKEFFRDFLKAIPIQLRQIQSLLVQGLSENITPPQISLDGVVAQLRDMINDNLETFSKPIQSCFGDGKHLSKEESDLKKECENAILLAKDAFIKFTDFLENDYVPNLRTEISASKGYPNGEEYYIDCLKFHTTTSMSPMEIHQLGLDEVQRVRKEMEVIASKDGYKGRLDQYLEYLRTSTDFEPKSATALLAHYRDLTQRLYPALLNIFHMRSLPRQPLKIIETPTASAHMAPAAYYLAGSTDAPRPGMFYVNTSKLATRRTYECEALALHEAIPGHHIQGAIQAECNLPEFRKYAEDRRYFESPCRFPFYTGYIEGWGLYSETLGKELGLYNYPSDEFGQLSMEALRSSRLVVDTGMHFMGWSHEQAVQYMLENTAMGEHDARTEVTRYVTWPGQATAYKVGERFIRRMRDYAETELQDRFDVRDFHDVVLLCGAVPLDVLEARVKEYVEGVKYDTSKSPNLQKPPAGSAQEVANSSFIESMTFVNWCKCCVVPGACQV